MVVKKEAHQPNQSSHLFTLRLWLEDLGDGRADWRGKVQHVNSGEARYFRDWPTLEAFVRQQLGEINPTPVRFGQEGGAQKGQNS
jgi:hypothetical protein